MPTVPVGEPPVGRDERESLWRALKSRGRKVRAAATALFKPMDVIIDSLGVLPGVDAFGELKDATSAILEHAAAVERGEFD